MTETTETIDTSGQAAGAPLPAASSMVTRSSGRDRLRVPASLAGELDRVLERARAEGWAQRIWDRDAMLWTNVGDAHLGFFVSADAIADAKGEILEGARASDLLVANADDPRVMAHSSRFAGRRITFGVSDGHTRPSHAQL